MATWQEIIEALQKSPTSEHCAGVLRGLQESYDRYPENTLMILKDYGLSSIEELPGFINSLCRPPPEILPVEFDPVIVNPRRRILPDAAWNLIRANFDLFWLEPSWPSHSLVLVDSTVVLPKVVTLPKGFHDIPISWWSNIIGDAEWIDIAYILNPKNPNYVPINPDFLSSYYRAIIRSWEAVVGDLHPYFGRWEPNWEDESLENYRHWAFITKLLSRLSVLTLPNQQILAEALFELSTGSAARGIIKALIMLYLYYLNPGKVPRVTAFLQNYWKIWFP